MRGIPLIAVTLIAGCFRPQFRAPGVAADDGWTQGERWGQEVCNKSEQMVELYSKAASALAAYDPRAELLRDPDYPVIRVCMTPEPVPCCAGGACAITGTVDPDKYYFQERAGRTAGCYPGGSERSINVSLNWPPVCTPEWPDEPYCVESVDDYDRLMYFSTGGVKRTFAYELIHYYADMVLGVHSEKEEQERWDELGLGAVHSLLVDSVRGVDFTGALHQN